MTPQHLATLKEERSRLSRRNGYKTFNIPGKDNRVFYTLIFREQRDSLKLNQSHLSLETLKKAMKSSKVTLHFSDPTSRATYIKDHLKNYEDVRMTPKYFCLGPPEGMLPNDDDLIIASFFNLNEFLVLRGDSFVTNYKDKCIRIYRNRRDYLDIALFPDEKACEKGIKKDGRDLSQKVQIPNQFLKQNVLEKVISKNNINTHVIKKGDFWLEEINLGEPEPFRVLFYHDGKTFQKRIFLIPEDVAKFIKTKGLKNNVGMKM